MKVIVYICVNLRGARFGMRNLLTNTTQASIELHINAHTTHIASSRYSITLHLEMSAAQTHAQSFVNSYKYIYI